MELLCRGILNYHQVKDDEKKKYESQLYSLYPYMKVEQERMQAFQQDKYYKVKLWTCY